MNPDPQENPLTDLPSLIKAEVQLIAALAVEIGEVPAEKLPLGMACILFARLDDVRQHFEEVLAKIKARSA